MIIHQRALTRPGKHLLQCAVQSSSVVHEDRVGVQIDATLAQLVAYPSHTSCYRQRLVVAAEERRDDHSFTIVVDPEDVVELVAVAHCVLLTRQSMRRVHADLDANLPRNRSSSGRLHVRQITM